MDLASCCDALSSALPGNVFLPNSTTYLDANSHRWSGTASSLQPNCVVLPTCTEDVATAMQVLTQNQCLFAVKSGGHMAVAGFNNIDDGVTLDLSRINTVEVSPDLRTSRLGAGAEWQRVYDKTPDVVVPGGLCGGTGVGGVALGGGMSIFLAEKGWTANNIIDYEIVLANGSIVHANQASNPDLFLALKGGGSNFGVLTHITVNNAQLSNLVYAGQVINLLTDQSTSSLLKALTKYTKANNKDQSAGLQTMFKLGSDGKDEAETLYGHRVGPVSVIPFLPPAIFGELLRVPSQTLAIAAPAPMNVMSSIAQDAQADGFRDAIATITFKNDQNTIEAVHKITHDICNQIADVPDLDCLWNYVPLPDIVTANSLKRGGDVLGLDRKRIDRMVVFFSPRWLDAQYDDRMTNASVTWFNQAKAATVARGTDDEFLYLNFAGGFQDPISGYGAKNVEFLRRVAAEYDPQGVFQKLVPGGFKLPAM
ncbi:oxidoreductase [Apiospora marii]|uniref:Oxidoreductase n=1 Tax=Apiospora marii TaxID=335849 RepID=A0ABR1RC46_9PEZI